MRENKKQNKEEEKPVLKCEIEKKQDLIRQNQNKTMGINDV